MTFIQQSQMTQIFGPQAELARELLQINSKLEDGAHDLGHAIRVWKAAQTILSQEGGNQRILLASALLHDSTGIEKNHPDRHLASRISAHQARQVLADLGWNKTERAQVYHAIEAHSITAGIPPRTLEAAILRDADRLDSLGVIGFARCMYVAGRMSSRLYDLRDPLGEKRCLDGKLNALDHVRERLLNLHLSFLTRTGQDMANERAKVVSSLYQSLLKEIGVLEWSSRQDDAVIASPVLA